MHSQVGLLNLEQLPEGGFGPDDQADLQFAQAKKEAERVRQEETDRAEPARIAEEFGDTDRWPSMTGSAP